MKYANADPGYKHHLCMSPCKASKSKPQRLLLPDLMTQHCLWDVRVFVCIAGKKLQILVKAVVHEEKQRLRFFERKGYPIDLYVCIQYCQKRICSALSMTLPHR